MGRHKAIPFKLIALVVLLRATPLFAQFDFPSMTGSGAAMGGMSVSINDPRAAYATIADLAQMQTTTISLSVRQNLMADGLGLAAASAAMPLKFGGIALSALHFGDADYNEQNISAAYALPLGERLSLGGAFHYLHSATSDPYYTPLHRLTFSVAMRYMASDKFSVAFKVYNPIAVLSDDVEGVHTPSIFTLGLSYCISDELLAAAEVEKNLFYDATVRFGLQYCFLERYYARVGLATQPALYTFGFGAQWGHLGADFAFQFSNPLGLTPLVSLSYSF